MNQSLSSHTRRPPQESFSGAAAPESDPAYEEVRRLLLRLGANPRYTGFGYTACAVSLSLNAWPRALSLTKEIYPCAARYYHVSPCCIDRNIRTLISVLWQENADLLRRAADCPLPEKPTCGAFIAILTERLALATISQQETTGIFSAFPPYPAAPRSDPDHPGQNARRPPSAGRWDAADPACG